MADEDNGTKVDAEKAPEGFKRDQLSNVVKIEVRLPLLYPSTLKDPFTVYMRLQLIKEAEEAQSQFLSLSDDEMKAATHEYDAKMISLLSVQAPTGFTDFPEIDNDPNVLRQTIYDYLLFVDGNEDQREAMAFICRTLASRYRRAVSPSDYL